MDVAGLVPGGNDANPTTDRGKIEADFRNGFITREERDKLVSDLSAPEGLDPKDVASIEATIRDDVRADMGTYEQRRESQNIIEAAAKGEGVSDVALVTAFAKVLDPTSVVREGEFATIQSASGVVPAMKQELINVLSGTKALDPKLKRDIIALATDIYNRSADTATTMLGNYHRIANRQGVNPDNIYAGEQPYTIEGRPSGQPLSQMRPPNRQASYSTNDLRAAVAKLKGQEIVEFQQLPKGERAQYLISKGYLQ
mgnify:CR=1 FL=1